MRSVPSKLYAYMKRLSAMNKFLKIIGELIGRILAYIWKPTFSEKGNAFVGHIYTGWLRNKFNHIGNDTIIAYKATNLKGCRNISIGACCQIEPHAQLTVWNSNAQLVLGDSCMLRQGIHISVCNSIVIGNNLLTGTNVLISDNSHGQSTFEDLSLPPLERLNFSKGGINIGNNVWLGNNVCVLSGAKIGNGVIVGANSVVTHDIPDYCIAVGVPAKVIRNINQKVKPNV